MTFWTIYCPVFAALLSAFLITEVFHFSLEYYVHKKQEKTPRELKARIASGEIDPMSMMFGEGSSPGRDFPLPVASGDKPSGSEISHGQYL